MDQIAFLTACNLNELEWGYYFVEELFVPRRSVELEENFVGENTMKVTYYGLKGLTIAGATVRERPLG